MIFLPGFVLLIPQHDSVHLPHRVQVVYLAHDRVVCLVHALAVGRLVHLCLVDRLLPHLYLDPPDPVHYPAAVLAQTHLSDRRTSDRLRITPACVDECSVT